METSFEEALEGSPHALAARLRVYPRLSVPEITDVAHGLQTPRQLHSDSRSDSPDVDIHSPGAAVVVAPPDTP
jgi:hypothetical protein